jgi:hypothetical protein
MTKEHNQHAVVMMCTSPCTHFLPCASIGSLFGFGASRLLTPHAYVTEQISAEVECAAGLPIAIQRHLRDNVRAMALE